LGCCSEGGKKQHCTVVMLTPALPQNVRTALVMQGVSRF